MVAFALRVLVAHHVLQHDANAATGQLAQILLARQRWDALSQVRSLWYPSFDNEQAEPPPF